MRRRDVANMLALGNVPKGLHRDSVLLSDAIAMARHSEAIERERYDMLRIRIAELQAVLEEQRLRADRLRFWHVRLRRYSHNGDVASNDQHPEDGQPDREPQAHGR